MQQRWHGQPKSRSSSPHVNVPNSSHFRHVRPRQTLPHSSGHDVGMGGVFGGSGDGGGAGGGSGGGGGGGGSAGGSFRQQPEQSQLLNARSCEQVMPPPKSSHCLHVLPLQSLAHESGSDGGLGGSGELGGGGELGGSGELGGGSGRSRASASGGWAGGGWLCGVTAGAAARGVDRRALSFVRMDAWLRSGIAGHLRRTSGCRRLRLPAPKLHK
jgi:hypothetical protein